jgi:hypothetical protein
MVQYKAETERRKREMRYDTETGTFVLSVRELCARAHKSGSIDARFPHRGREVMQKGSELHRKLQAKEGPGYQAEVFLRHTTIYNGIFYTVEGRADGVFEENGLVTVDEIKTTRGGKSARADAFLSCNAMPIFCVRIEDFPVFVCGCASIIRKPRSVRICARR